MALRSCLVACMALSFPVLAADPPTPADPSRPVTVQTVTTQSWIPGRWVRVENQDVWQPGHWETVQTTTTGSLAAAPAAAPVPVPVPVVVQPAPSASPSWISERWEQSPDGWTRYAGRWSNQPDVIVERRPIELPTRTVVVERPVETVVVERPVSTTSVAVGLGYGAPYLGIGYNYGTPYYGWGVSVPIWGSWCRPAHHCPPAYRPPPMRPPMVKPPPVRPVTGGYVRHH